MKHEHLLLPIFVVAVVWLTLGWQGTAPAPASTECRQILAELRHECDPANPGADYSWTQNTMPTERKREAILQRCRLLGPSLLPEVRAALAAEKSDEVRGMLTVIAAALGDADCRLPAAKEMTWSYYPALKISAAKTLRRLKDRELIPWFRMAMKDDHFVVNGGCGLLREKFFPVRSLAETALRDFGVEPIDEETLIRKMQQQKMSDFIKRIQSEHQQRLLLEGR
jgi:hypothetical protein